MADTGIDYKDEISRLRSPLGPGKGFGAAARLSGVIIPGPAAIAAAFGYLYRQVAATFAEVGGE